MVGGSQNRSGFEKLPDVDPAGAAVIVAARKSRQHKNVVAAKIGLAILTLSAVLAGLAALILTKNSGSADLKPIATFAERGARKMNADIKDEAGLARVAEATEKFSRSLYSAMVKDVGAADNLLVSAFSAAAVLTMAAAGARGDTAQQMWAGLGLPDTETAEAGWSQAIPALRTNMYFTLETANTAFVDEKYKILDEYKESIQRIFHSDVSPVDFGDSGVTSKRINSWVSDMTNKKIEKLVDAQEIGDDTAMVLVNAIYFKGDWVKKFDSKNTQKQEFSVSSGKNVMADMMRQTKEFPFATLDDIDSKMLELPYEGERIVMQILLPNDKDSGLKSIEEKIGDADIAKIFEEKQFNRKVNIQMPKFKLTHSASLAEALRSLGMKNMFSAGVADFSGMDGTRNLYVGFVKQEVAVEVNEEGSEAAAATGMGMMMRSMPAPPQEFVVDHPFIFYIRDKLTGMLLFQGRVANPTL